MDYRLPPRLSVDEFLRRFLLHQNGALHEPLSTSSVFARASARTQILRLIRPKTLRCQPLRRQNQASKSHWPPPFEPQANRLHQIQPVRDPPPPTRAHSKYIGFPVGGFLQVAVSEAPLSENANPSCFAGRSRYSTKTFRTHQPAKAANFTFSMRWVEMARMDFQSTASLP